MYIVYNNKIYRVTSTKPKRIDISELDQTNNNPYTYNCKIISFYKGNCPKVFKLDVDVSLQQRYYLINILDEVLYNEILISSRNLLKDKRMIMVDQLTEKFYIFKGNDGITLDKQYWKKVIIGLEDICGFKEFKISSSNIKLKEMQQLTPGDIVIYEDEYLIFKYRSCKGENKGKGMFLDYSGNRIFIEDSKFFTIDLSENPLFAIKADENIIRTIEYNINKLRRDENE